MTVSIARAVHLLKRIENTTQVTLVLHNPPYLQSRTPSFQSVSCHFFYHHHHNQPDYAHCRTKASPMFHQSTRSSAYRGHVIPTILLISSGHLTSLLRITRLPSLGILLMTGGYFAYVLHALHMPISSS
uniref:Uncharacterized protein n=1 Tax=Rhipicephalus appendiculatus TaxID=34631 RepID=A0A131YKD9_RHIAP